jgi:hypothetical protein
MSTDFDSMSMLEIFKWLHDHDGWSKDWFDDELYPYIEERFNKE